MTASAFSKNANPQLATPVQAADAADNNYLKSEALKSVLLLLGGGLAAGAGMRAWSGRRYLFGQPQIDEEKERQKQRLGGQFVPLPYPVPKSAAAEAVQKLAGIMDRTVVAGEPLPPSYLMRGDHANYKSTIPWFLPASALAMLGGFFGGNALTDKVLDTHRKTDLESEVEQAKREYQRALLSQFQTGKRAEDESVGDQIGRELDEIVEILDKKALWGDVAGGATGAALTLAALLSLGSGYLSYNAAKSRSPSKLLEEAYKRRQRELAAARPPELTIVPVPVRGYEEAERLPHPGTRAAPVV